MARESKMSRKLLEELAKGNELTISLTRISAKGGFAVALAFLLALLLLLALAI